MEVTVTTLMIILVNILAKFRVTPIYAYLISLERYLYIEVYVYINVYKYIYICSDPIVNLDFL